MKNRLKEAMQEKKISCDYLAKKVDVTTTTIINWRKADELKPQTIDKIATALNIEADELRKQIINN